MQRTVSSTDICPVCHTLVTVSNAGIQDNVREPRISVASSADGSNHRSSPTTPHAQEVTSPYISIPASARAVLAATEPEATQPSIPSFSMIVTKISIHDLGKRSSLREGRRDC